MLSDGLKYMTLNDPQQSEILLVVPIPHEEDAWGSLAVLRGTIWEEHITVVSGAVMSDALHGYATPLMRMIGREPRHRARMISDESPCAISNLCAMATGICRPGPKMPECYEAPLTDPAARHMASLVALAWKEGRYAVVVEGDGWNLL